ncbi:MAG TPA: VOC family protein [Phycisphaerales bacterium]|nr:VOC family protein [Phycisphaerales bacterium]HMP38608.1 VOC family protein [Phycisphaerales bacterium]
MPDPTPLTGIHHVTALAASPQKNLDFYARALGLRLIKRTVNFDDPGTYHLYYGDGVGSPGTLLTHFPHPLAARGRHGAPEIAETLLAVPHGSIERWAERLDGFGVESGRDDRDGPPRLRFEDPDGMLLALVERDERDRDPAALPPGSPWPGARGAEVDPEIAIATVDSVALHVEDLEEITAFLVEAMGFVVAGERGGSRCMALPPTTGAASPAGRVGARLELVERREAPPPVMGAGSVHHVAWRVPDAAAQGAIAERIRTRGVAVTRVVDRCYFRSIYFRVPGGLVFEIATDGPGFTIDEPLDRLGEALQLPPFLESRRSRIESLLVPVEPPGAGGSGAR